MASATRSTAATAPATRAVAGPRAGGTCATCSTSSGRRSSSSASCSRRDRTRATGHHRRAAQPAGRRAPLPVRAMSRADPRGARSAHRAALHRVRRKSARRSVDRPGPSRPLPNGRHVAVKVQRPNAPRQIEADLALMYQAARLAKERIRAPDFIDANEIVDEFARSIRQELDYRLEARNADGFHRNFAGHPHVACRGSSGRTRARACSRWSSSRVCSSPTSTLDEWRSTSAGGSRI